MLHQPEVTLRGCVREAVPVTESFGKHARRCYLKKNNGSKLKIIPLGGLEQIGMNITVFEYEDSIIVVDCGLAFPEDDMLGIDLVIPDVTYLKENIDKVKGFVITHGHEDHIGALPYILKEVNVPVYATKLTIGLIENKLKEHNLLRTTKRKIIKHGQSINLGAFRIEFIKTTTVLQMQQHWQSTPRLASSSIQETSKSTYTPVFGDVIDLQRFAEIGKKGVLALMCDSTNAERPGFTMSERTVGKTIDGLFAEHQNSRIIIATFASNVDRVQQIINSAYKYGRKVVIEGRSMVNIISIAQELGYINIPENTLIDVEQMKNYTGEQLVLITTGSQGESMAALSRMAAHLHKKISILPGDTVIFSSHPIPGNEKRRFERHQRTVCTGCQRRIPGRSRIRTCLPGGNQADLLPGKTEIRDPSTRRIPSLKSTRRSSTEPRHPEREHLPHVFR